MEDEDVGRMVSIRLFSHGIAHRIYHAMPLRESVPLTFTPASDPTSRVTQLLELAREQVLVAKALAAPRMHETLTELDYILEDQIAALANAIEDDKADTANRAA